MTLCCCSVCIGVLYLVHANVRAEEPLLLLLCIFRSSVHPPWIDEVKTLRSVKLASSHYSQWFEVVMRFFSSLSSLKRVTRVCAVLCPAQQQQKKTTQAACARSLRVDSHKLD